MTYPLSERLLGAIVLEFPEFRIVPKDGNAFSRLIDVSLRIVTAGSMRRYMTHYHTVIGYTLYVAGVWRDMSDVARVVLLRHELVHLRQRRRYGFALFAFLYLVPWFPLGLSYGRARLEWEAYRETLAATLEFGGPSALTQPVLRDEIVRRYVSGDYGWMWPFPRTVGRWFDEAEAELLASHSARGPARAPDPE